MSTQDVVERDEMLQPEPAIALAKLLNVNVPDFDRDGLPLLWHWIYLLERPDQSDLGSDGHSLRGAVPAPAGPDRRRMAAGGRVTQLGPLNIGERATRRSEVISSTDKHGRSGRLTFVLVRHTISQGGQVRVVEEQDVVYRDATRPTGVLKHPDPLVQVALEQDDWSIDIDPTLLFRFSALTYNAHRIHYDRDYARTIEGYPGLVTHGPLQAMAMVEAVRRSGSKAQSLDFRAISPLFDHQGLVTRTRGNGAQRDVSVRDLSGRISSTGTVRIGE